MKDAIHIVVATDQNYWHLTAVMLLSLASHHRSKEKLVCHVITSGLTDRQKHSFIEFFHSKGVTIDWLSVDPAAFKDFPVVDYFTPATYYRVEIPQLLSPAIRKVIYLDADILLLDDISKLWHTDIKGLPIAAVENFHSFHKEFVGIPAEAKFFNGGVLLIDLDYWRRHNVSDQLKRIIVTQKEKMIYCDQEALNLLFYDKCFFLPPKWNYSPGHEDVIELFELYDRRPEFKEAVQKPSLVHFLGFYKPDNPEDFSVFADKYRSYFRKIPFVRERFVPLSLDQRKRKFLYQLDRILTPYWLKRKRLQSNPEQQRIYWPGLPDWYW